MASTARNHLRLPRFLQLSTDEASYSLPLGVFVMVLFALLFICIVKTSNGRRAPPREVILEQRRRQRALIRRTRLRQMGIDPDSLHANNNDAGGGVERIQLTAAQAETRRKYLVQLFQSTNVQTVGTVCIVQCICTVGLDRARGGLEERKYSIDFRQCN
jgi:hypothetical protein